METPDTESDYRFTREISPIADSRYRQTYSRQNGRRSFHNSDRREELIRNLTGDVKQGECDNHENHTTNNNKTAHATENHKIPEVQKNGTLADDRYKHEVEDDDKNTSHGPHRNQGDNIGMNGTSGHSNTDSDISASVDDSKSESRSSFTDVRPLRSRKSKGHVNIRFSDIVANKDDKQLAKSERINHVTQNGVDTDSSKLSSELRKYFENNRNNRDLIYKSRNVSRESSRKMSLKEYGLDDEITIRYVPPLRCSKVQQEVHIRELKKHVINRKQSAKSSRSAKSIGSGKSSSCRARSELKSSSSQRSNLRSKDSNKKSESNKAGQDELGNSSVNSMTDTKDDSLESRNDSVTIKDYDTVIEDMGNVKIGDSDRDILVDDILPDPKRPVYDALNSSTSMILLNNKEIKNSRLWRISISQQKNRGRLINPDRHKRDPSPKSGHISHNKCLSRSLERFEPTVKPFLEFPERPSSERIGDHLYEARLSVNPRRHRACAGHKKGPMAALDTSGEVIRHDVPTYKNEWLRIYSKPHERREPIKIKKDIPNFRDKIKSPAWSALNVPSIYNMKKKL